jgi:mono/diheme cytochrome c family protein
MNLRRAAAVAAGATALLATALLAPVASAGPGTSPSNGPSLTAVNSGSVHHGSEVFARYCVTCHGENADGKGRAARLFDPPPANLRHSDKNDAYFALIIRLGGGAIGRSSAMPSWSEELNDTQIRDLVAYLRSINERADMR